MEDSRKAWLRRHFPSVGFVAAAALAGGALAGIVVYVGAYDIGADAPPQQTSLLARGAIP